MSGGSKSSNDAIIAEQRRQEVQKAREDAEKQNRIDSGLGQIDAMYSDAGGDYTVPGSQSYVSLAGDPMRTQTFQTESRQGSDGNNEINYITKETLNPNWDPNKHEFTAGSTAFQEGMGQDFYDNFKTSILDFQQPEVERQFEEAKSQNLFDLARRGLRRSTATATAAGDLAREKSEADTRVTADAEGQTSGLRSDVAQSRKNAINLLYATEDPTAAANQARTEVNAIQTRPPQFSDLGALFESALTSYGNYQTGQQNRRAYEALGSPDPYASQGTNYG